MPTVSLHPDLDTRARIYIGQISMMKLTMP